MSGHWGNVLLAYIATGVGVGAYAAWVIARGRSVGVELGIGEDATERSVDRGDAS